MKKMKKMMFIKELGVGAMGKSIQERWSIPASSSRLSGLQIQAVDLKNINFNASGAGKKRGGGVGKKSNRNAHGNNGNKGEDFFESVASESELELEEEPIGASHNKVLLSPSGEWVEFQHAVPINRNFVLETTAKGDQKSIVDFHLKAKSGLKGNMSILDLASNLDNSHRLTLETTNITDTHGSSVQCTVSTQLPPKKIGRSTLPVLDWGLATHTRLSKRTTLFSRLFCDDVFGQQLVAQTSYHMKRKKNGQQYLLSGLGAINFGNDVGAGFSITKLFPRRKDGFLKKASSEDMETTLSATDSVELRALCSKSGNHSLSLNANFGVVS